jgi:hypothetical protein
MQSINTYGVRLINSQLFRTQQKKKELTRNKFKFYNNLHNIAS